MKGNTKASLIFLVILAVVGAQFTTAQADNDGPFVQVFHPDSTMMTWQNPPPIVCIQLTWAVASITDLTTGENFWRFVPALPCRQVGNVLQSSWELQWDYVGGHTYQLDSFYVLLGKNVYADTTGMIWKDYRVSSVFLPLLTK